MKKTVNPGSSLTLEGSFELGASLADVEGPEEFEFHDLVGVLDRESLTTVYLADLLRSFLADPTDKVTGPIRITIEPAPWPGPRGFEPVA